MRWKWSTREAGREKLMDWEASSVEDMAAVVSISWALRALVCNTRGFWVPRRLWGEGGDAPSLSLWGVTVLESPQAGVEGDHTEGLQPVFA